MSLTSSLIRFGLLDANGKMNYQYLFRDYREGETERAKTKKTQKSEINIEQCICVWFSAAHFKHTHTHKTIKSAAYGKNATENRQILLNNCVRTISVLPSCNWVCQLENHRQTWFGQDILLCLTLLSIYHKLYYHTADQCSPNSAILHHSVNFQFLFNTHLCFSC